MQTLEIARIMCHEGVIWSNKNAVNTLCKPILTAARFGIYELVQEILKAYFYSFTFTKKGLGILHFAILHRHEQIFSLVKNMNLFIWDWKAASSRKNTDNILHLAGRLVPSREVPGAAFQMQRELQWFKVINVLYITSVIV